MAFWTVKTDDGSIADVSESKYIFESGIYPVVIKNCIAKTSPADSGKEAKWVDLIIDHEGTIQTLYYAIRINNNDGSDNKFGQNLFNRLCLVCGAKSGFDVETVKKHVCTNHKMDTYEDVEVIEELEGNQIFIRVTKKYQRYNGEIRRRMELKNVFRGYDKASAMEIAKRTEIGKQYAKELETCTEVQYQDGITPEEAAEYERNRANGVSNDTQSQEPPKRRFGSFGGSEDASTTNQEIDEMPF